MVRMFVIMLLAIQNMISFAQTFKPDTISLSIDFKKINHKELLQFDSIAIEINKYPDQNFGVWAYCKSSKMAFAQGLDIINYLVDKANIERYRLILFYDNKATKRELIIIRPVVDTDTKGCIPPPQPNVKR